MRRSIGMPLAALLLALVLVEGLLWLAALASPRVALLLSPGIPTELPDPVLEQRPNPAMPDHDARGYRNPEALDRADVVVLGDSQTYGSEVSRDSAWPLVLGRRLGVPAYSISLGGWGPAQYFLLADEAFALEPEVLVVALYAGNDFRDAYEFNDRHPVPELSAGSPHPPETYRALDAERGRLGRVWRESKDLRRGRVKAWIGEKLEPLEEHIKIWGLIRGLSRLEPASEVNMKTDSVRRDFDSYAAKVEHLPRDLFFPFRAGDVATVLTPAGRAAVADRSDPRVQEGIRISLAAVSALHARSEGRCAFLVVLIPTKELAYAEAVEKAERAGAAVPPAYRALVEEERALWRDLRHDLEARGITVLDSRPALQRAIREGRNPYHSDWDGHPNVIGNEAIAEAVARAPVFEALAR